MPVADEARVKTECNLPQVLDAAITPHLAKAELTLRDRLTDAVYDGIKDGTGDYVPADLVNLESSEALEAGAFALPFLNIKSGGAGLVRSTGHDANRTDLLSHSQIMALAKEFRDQALLLIRKYIPKPALADEPVSGITIGGLRLTSAGGEVE